MRRYLIIAAILLFTSCSKTPENNDTPPQQETTDKAAELMGKLWSTSPLNAGNTDRKSTFAELQGYADGCANTIFSNYLTANETVASSLENSTTILGCYDAAFDRVLDGIKNDRLANGEVHIWMLYNMGYLVKTPSGCFAIDIYHRRAAELAPYLDFYCITHVHQDHKSESLIEAMKTAGKPVLSNFLEGSVYTSTETSDYTIGTFKIHTFITNHNNGSTNVPVTVFQVSCDGTAGNFVLLHSGDSNFIPAQYDVTADIDVYIPRYAPNALTENDIIGAVIHPEYVLLAHILELSHKDPSDSRWTLEQGLVRASQLNCDKTYMPFWGEKLIWKNGKLN